MSCASAASSQIYQQAISTDITCGLGLHSSYLQIFDVLHCRTSSRPRLNNQGRLVARILITFIFMITQAASGRGLGLDFSLFFPCFYRVLGVYDIGMGVMQLGEWQGARSRVGIGVFFCCSARI